MFMPLMMKAGDGDQKLVVLSDPHVMAPELLVSEGKAWTNYLKGQRKMIDYSARLFDEMVSRIKSNLHPDLVLITGDLTKDGEQLSHAYVKTKLDELRSEGIQVLVVPGNHDHDGNRNAVSYDGAGTAAVEVATNDWFAAQYADYGYGPSSEREASTLTYACEPIDGLVVIGIDSGRNGELSSTTLDWVCDKARKASSEGKRVIAMMHHPLIPHVTHAETLVRTYVIKDFDTIRQALIEAGIKVIFTGHFHTSDIAKDFNDSLTKEIYDVNTGSLVSYPCDYREVTLSDDLSELRLTTSHITSLPNDDTFSSDYAKECLHSAVKQMVKEIAKAKVRKEAGALGVKLMAKKINKVSTAAADAFIIHAEGNEGQVDTSDIMESFEQIFQMVKGSREMCESMLQDKAPYGIEGRENVTDDLNLSISLINDNHNE
jgi:3',5'-cyclic AMP phosphodiesterase CpdA